MVPPEMFHKKFLKHSVAWACLTSQINTEKIMDSNTSVAIMFASAFGATALIVAGILSYRLKSRMLRLGLTDVDTLKFIHQIEAQSRTNVLKWALLLFFGGLGMILLHYRELELNDPLPYGIEAIFVSLGLLIHYLLTRQKNQ
jgi:hypothetical protein